MRRPGVNWWVAAWSLAVLLAVQAVPALAGQPYYAGKTVEIIVPFGEGGGTDVWARFVAPYLQKYLDGNPRVLVRNMPGGEGMAGSNWFAANARPDGLLVLASSGTSVFHWLLDRPQVRYDFDRMVPVVVTATGGVIYSSPTVARSIRDLLNPSRPLVYGGISATGLDLVTLLSFEVLRLNVRSVLGFEGRGPARLAFERGETNLDYQTTSAYLTQVVPLIQEGKAVPLMTFGVLAGPGRLDRDPAVKDLPTVAEAHQILHGRPPEGPAWRAYLATNTAGFAYQKILWVPQGTPQEAIAAFDRAVERMNADPEFHRQGEAVLGGYPTFGGSQVGEAVRDALSLSADVKAYLKDLLRTKFGVRL